MKRYILVRHGQSMYNAGLTDNFDSDTTERGDYQIQEAALHVRDVMDISWECMLHDFVGFVSPYQRCLKTAFPIHDRWGVKMTVEPRIGETPADQKKLRIVPIESRFHDFPTYEWGGFPRKGLDVTDRTIEDYWKDLYSFCNGLPEEAIIVSHLTTIKDLTSILSDKSTADLKEFTVSNCSVTLVEEGKLVYIGKR